MPKIDKKLELLAPAGNLHKMKTALAFGADAIYVGVPAFSLRVRINDFDINGIKEAAEYCHSRKKKVYATINIFAHERHFKNLSEHIRSLKGAKVDALIVSDPGIIRAIKEVWPGAELHLSTQANCTNARSAKFWEDAGISRIILGREVTLKEIKEIKKQCPDLELEYFVHGAMCMAYSGRCFLSKLFTDRSANMGDCIQPCRWGHGLHTVTDDTNPAPTLRSGYPSSLDDARDRQEGTNSKSKFFIKAEGREEALELIEEEHGSYILNSKDLCLIKYLRELRDAGITSFKIEGRAKSPYYQAVVAGIYSEVLRKLDSVNDKDLDFYYRELATKLVHRGYSTGFLLGEKGDQNLNESHKSCGWEFCGQVLKTADDSKQTAEEGVIFVKVHNTIKIGDEIEIVRPKYDIIKIRVEKLLDAETGEEIKEAHGGQEGVVVIKVDGNIPEYSVLRRRL